MKAAFKSTARFNAQIFESCCHWPNARETLFLLSLCLLGITASYLNFDLFLGVNFLFGSIATMIAVRMSGTLWGILVGLSIGFYMYILLGNAYAIIIYGLEAFFVGCIIFGFRKDNIILIDTIFWLFAGLPLVWLPCHYQQGLTESAALLVTLEKMTNGIANAVIASLILQFTPLNRWLSSTVFLTEQKKITLHSVTTTLLAASVLLPMLLITVISGNIEFVESQRELALSAREEAEDTGRKVTSLLENYMAVLASVLTDRRNNDMTSWRSNLDNLSEHAIPGLLHTEIANSDGEILFSHPKRNVGASPCASAISSLASNSLYLSEIHLDASSGEPHFTIITPLTGGRYLAASFSTRIFREILDDVSSRGYYTELLTGQTDTIASNKTRDFSLFVQGTNPQHLLPEDENLHSMIRWKQAFLQDTEMIMGRKGWSIRVRIPMADSILFLEQDYIIKLSTMLFTFFVLLIFIPKISRLLTSPLENVTRLATELANKPDAKNIIWSTSDIFEIDNLVDQFKHFFHNIIEKQQALTKSEAQYSGIIEASNDAIISIGEDQNISLFNHGAEEIFGYSAGDIVGKSITELMPETFRKHHKSYVEEFSRDSKNSRNLDEHTSIMGVRKNGEVFTASAAISKLSANGVMTFTIILRDTSERELVLQENMSIAQDMTRLVDTANAPIFGIDAYGKINEWNQQSEKITGFIKQEVIGQDLVAGYIADEYKLSVGEILAQALIGRETANYEFPLYTKSGDRVDILLNSTTRRDAFGKIIGVVGVGQDITELKHSQEQVIQSSKMATLGKMATSVAHELNQPLNVIRMAAGNSRRKISKGDIDPTYLSEKLSRIEAQTARASAIIDHMRMFGRETKEQRKKIDARKTVTNALELVGEQLRLTGVSVVVEFAEDCVFIFGEEIHIEQVILSLISNAQDAMADRSGEAKITLRVFEDEDGVHIILEDTGGGIPEGDLPRIFEPFYTTKTIAKGTGLGLSVCYGIVSDMEGTIVASNTLNGTKFTITLPSFS